MRKFLTVSNLKDFYVKKGLNAKAKESVALSIFMEVSMGFESLQSGFPYSLVTNSGFSAEDLVSDLIGFYRAVRPGTDYIKLCQPVSKLASIDVWDSYGEVGNNKNKSFTPFFYSCKECKDNQAAFNKRKLSAEFTLIEPAKKGIDFRDWNSMTDTEAFKYSIMR